MHLPCGVHTFSKVRSLATLCIEHTIMALS
jgi:hypothetical protein